MTMFGRWLSDKAQKHSLRSDRNHTGQIAEEKACQWLQQQGLTLLESNYSCRAGEIDLVMRDRQQLIFVEVRYRSHSSFGGAAASVDRRKQQKLIKAATHYLGHHPQLNHLPCRFDVIAAQVENNSVNMPPEVHWRWIKNAFMT